MINKKQLINRNVIQIFISGYIEIEVVYAIEDLSYSLNIHDLQRQLSV